MIFGKVCDTMNYRRLMNISCCYLYTCILYCMCKFVYFWLLFFLFISMHVGFVSSFTGTHVYTIAIGLRVYLPKIMTCCSKNILLDRYCEFIQNNGAVTET